MEYAFLDPKLWWSDKWVKVTIMGFKDSSYNAKTIFLGKNQHFFFFFVIFSSSVFLKLYVIAGINKLMKVPIFLKMVQVSYYCALNQHVIKSLQNVMWWQSFRRKEKWLSSFFQATLKNPSECFWVQRWHALYFFFHCFVLPDSFTVTTGSRFLFHVSFFCVICTCYTQACICVWK